MAVKPGLGLTLPVKLGNNGYFQVAWDVPTQTKSNLINLILTKKGERVMQPEFGCDIHNIIFEQVSSDIEANVKGTIEEAVAVWMPFVSIEGVEIQKNEDFNRVNVSITYSIKLGITVTDNITLVI